MTRREFLQFTPKQAAELHCSCQLGIVPGRDFNEKFDLLQACGFDRAELSGGNYLWLEKNEDALAKAIAGRGMKFSVACVGGGKGNAGLADPAIRKEVVEVTKRVLASTGRLGAVGAIVCPARSKIELPFKELRERFLAEILPGMLETAAKAGTCVVLEPLNRQETMFLRQVADAAAIARDAHSPAIGCMGDFWHMTFEETSDMGAFVSAGDYLKHVHIASRKTRKIPGSDGAADNYVDGFRGLKMIGYRGAVSIEAGYPSGAKTIEDKKRLLAAAVKQMKEQWEQA